MKVQASLVIVPVVAAKLPALELAHPRAFGVEQPESGRRKRSK